MRTIVTRSKYNARKTVCASSHQHDSRLEAKRCDELRLLVRAGQITDLVIQPQFWFVINGLQLFHDNGRRVGYKADFSYREGHRRVVEDCKGATTPDWPLRKAVFKACFPQYELVEIRR